MHLNDVLRQSGIGHRSCGEISIEAIERVEFAPRMHDFRSTSAEREHGQEPATGTVAVAMSDALCGALQHERLAFLVGTG